MESFVSFCRLQHTPSIYHFFLVKIPLGCSFDIDYLYKYYKSLFIIGRYISYIFHALLNNEKASIL